MTFTQRCVRAFFVCVTQHVLEGRMGFAHVMPTRRANDRLMIDLLNRRTQGKRVLHIRKMAWQGNRHLQQAALVVIVGFNRGLFVCGGHDGYRALDIR